MKQIISTEIHNFLNIENDSKALKVLEKIDISKAKLIKIAS